MKPYCLHYVPVLFCNHITCNQLNCDNKDGDYVFQVAHLKVNAMST